MKTKLDELKKIWNEKFEAHMTIRERYRKYEEKLKKEMYAKLDKEFRKQLDKAYDEREVAHKAMTDEENAIRVAEGIKNLQYPEGTIMVKWEGYPTKRATNVKAVLQIYRSGDKLPDNMRWGRPCVGDMVLRFIKSNGMVGSKVQRWGGKWNELWLPIGEVPKEEVNA